MRHAQLLALSLFLVVGTCVAGCQNGGVQNPFQRRSAPPPVEMMDSGQPVAPVQPGLPLATEQRFRDVPLPTGLHEEYDRSYVYETANLQIGRMVYTSRASLNELANFYIREAPTADWRLESALQADRSQTLIFRKPGRRLEVKVQAQGVGRRNLLILNLTPENGTGL